MDVDRNGVGALRDSAALSKVAPWGWAGNARSKRQGWTTGAGSFPGTTSQWYKMSRTKVNSVSLWYGYGSSLDYSSSLGDFVGTPGNEVQFSRRQRRHTMTGNGSKRPDHSEAFPISGRCLPAWGSLKKD